MQPAKSLICCFFALKRQGILAQGNALGHDTLSSRQPPYKGKVPRFFLALAGRLKFLALHDPGRCPGLLCVSLTG